VNWNRLEVSVCSRKVTGSRRWKRRIRSGWWRPAASLHCL